MAKSHFGKLKPRYRFALNPFPDVRWSRCPNCEKLMHARKFPLLLHLGGTTLLTIGFTCRYCTPCEFIIAHQHELEFEIEIFKAQHPDVHVDDLFVIGTVDRKTWERSLGKRGALTFDELLEHTSDIKDYRVVSNPRRVWIRTEPRENDR